MEKGKRICEALKALRKRIADANDIPYEVEECTHKGDCPGTCPKCEAELRYLMEAIDKREQEGKPVVLDGIMSEEELRKAFSIIPAEENLPENPEEMETMGLPEPPEPLILMGEPEPPLEGEPKPFPDFRFASVISKSLLVKHDSNFVFSPAGLCSILEILQKGMDIHSNLYNLIDVLISGFYSEVKSDDDEDFNLAHAIGVWYDKNLGAVKEDFLEYIQDVYEAEAHNADFSQATKTKLWIDKWVADKTNHMIETLDTEIDKDSLMVLLDAIYMKAKWEEPFDSSLTDTDIFHNADGSESEVDMMYQDIADADYAETKEYQVITLPYKSYKYSMVLVLPKEGIDIDDIMCNSEWLEVATDTREVELYMPRFKFDNTLSFKEILTVLGLGDLFEKEDSLPNITDLPAHISEIKQQCVIKVEEEGTEAAAVTMAVCAAGCPPPDNIPETITMRIDRPFGFAIRGDFSQFLFMGIVKDMSENQL